MKVVLKDFELSIFFLPFVIQIPQVWKRNLKASDYKTGVRWCFVRRTSYGLLLLGRLFCHRGPPELSARLHCRSFSRSWDCIQMFRVSDVVCVLLCPLCFWHNVTRIMNGFGTFCIALLSVVLEQWADAFCERDDIPTNDNPLDVHLMIGYLLGRST